MPIIVCKHLEGCIYRRVDRRPKGIHDWQAEDEGQHDVRDETRQRAKGESDLKCLKVLRFNWDTPCQAAKTKAKL